MRKQCVPGSFFPAHALEPGNEARLGGVGATFVSIVACDLIDIPAEKLVIPELICMIYILADSWKITVQKV